MKLRPVLPVLLSLFAFNVMASEAVLSRIETATRYQALGYDSLALPSLADAWREAVSPDDQHVTALRLGSAMVDSGDYEGAQRLLMPLLDEDLEPVARSIALNDLGRIESAAGNVAAAGDYFTRSRDAAQLSGDRILEARVLVNKARAHLSGGDVRGLVATLKFLELLVPDLPHGAERVELQIAEADVLRAAYWQGRFGGSYLESAQRLLASAATGATRLSDRRLLSWAIGQQGRLYEDLGRLDEATRLTRSALFEANAAGAYESAYIWEWQLARLNEKSGDGLAAVAGYQRAIDTLEYVRRQLIDGSPYTFHERVQPVFTELADLLLQRAHAESGTRRQQTLARVQEVLERSKSAELQDYFQNECVLPEQSLVLDDIDPQTAVLYPILLSDRIEMLINVDGRIEQVTTPYDPDDFELLVDDWRALLERDQGDDEYLELAQLIYDLVIRPVLPVLLNAEVTTLLFVPDGSLRTVPLSALHDGESYLVESYAIATTPGLQLTMPQPLELSEISLFAGGVSESVQGFSGLPGVPVELENLAKDYGASIFRDSEFSLATVTDQMSSADFSVVHIATHGHFDSNPQKSFLLTYDDKLTMNRLEESIGFRRFSGDPLELLVLSACETAAGDNRAALGLAGVALKAGARSAIATLWQISDAATVELVTRFYGLTADRTVSKAKALQTAQRALIESDRFYHPSDWAPFLLIGNWL